MMRLWTYFCLYSARYDSTNEILPKIWMFMKSAVQFDFLLWQAE